MRLNLDPTIFEGKKGTGVIGKAKKLALMVGCTNGNQKGIARGTHGPKKLSLPIVYKLATTFL